MTYDNAWLYNGSPVEGIPEGKTAFVYILTNEETGKAYIGEKNFYASKTVQRKGKKKKVKIESDWKEYYSSSDEVKEMVRNGVKFRREILHFCANRGLANYLEAREQMDRRVLENPDKYYNRIINCRVHASHISRLEE